MSLLRRLVVWLAVLVTPLQGFGAVTLMLCGPAHHRPAVVANDADAGHAAHHAAVESAADHADATAIDVAAGCSLCAVCHAGAALPSSVAAVAVDAPDGAVALPRSPVRAGFVTGGPERPPRAFLA